MIVLPPLLYVAAYFTPVRGLRAKPGHHQLARGRPRVCQRARGGVIAHWLIPGQPWLVAIVLGAIVAPPDAIAATAIASRMGLPRQIVTILEGERLLNDATALTIDSLGLAVALAACSRRRRRW